MKQWIITLLLFTGSYELIAQAPPPCPNNNIPGAESCPEVCVYCDLDGYTGITNGTPSGGNVICGQISIHNDQWFGFVAGTSSITIEILTSNCQDGNGLQAAILEDCNQDALVCNPGGGGGGGVPLLLFYNNYLPGQTYYLMIDGWTGDVCDFEIRVQDGSVTAPAPGTPTAPQGPGQVCPIEEDAVYTIAAVPGAGFYQWSAPAGAQINGGGNHVQLPAPAGATVTITFGNTGGQVCVQAGNACIMNPAVACTPVNVPPAIVSDLPEAVRCAEDSPYVLPWGDTAVSSGVYQFAYGGVTGCDSILRQQVTFLDPIVVNLDPVIICAGDSIIICGDTLRQPGAYSLSCLSSLGCDSTINFNLILAEPIAGITAVSKGITCSQPQITLGSLPSIGDKLWLNHQGDTLSVGESLIVDTPARYRLRVTVPGSLGACVQEQNILIKANTTPPPVTAGGGTLTPDNPFVVLKASSLFSNVSYLWTGPNGFQSNLQYPVVNIPGTYTVTVTDLSTGCVSAVSVVVN